MRFSLVLFALVYIFSNALCQTVDSTSSLQASIPATDLAIAGFNQTLSTLNWVGDLNKNWSSDVYSISVDERFHSVLIKSNPNLIRDEQSFSGRAARQIYGNLFGYGVFRSNYTSDNRQIGLNSVGASDLLGGLFYATDNDTLLAGGGNKWDRQAGVENSGFAYTLFGSGIFQPVAGSVLVPTLNIHDEQIFPRRNTDRALSVYYKQIFSPQSLIGFTGAYTSQLRDFYFPADSVVQSLFEVTNNIQDRNDDRSTVAANILMPVWVFELSGQVSYAQRQVDFTYRYEPHTPTSNLYDTRIRTSNFNLHTDIKTNLDDDTVMVSLEHNERSEAHTVINATAAAPFVAQQMVNQAQLNSFGTRNTLSGQLFLHFGHTGLNVTGLASLFRYNTPSELNYDDRDELTNTLAFTLSRTFSPYLVAGIGGEADLIHMVYIKSQRSANNNRNFVYRLFPSVRYSDQTVSSYNGFEVLANYTVYDYEAFSQVHSFSFRQASFVDSTSLRVTSRVSLFFLANVKLYTRGELYWSSFSEFPLNYFQDETYWLSLSYTADRYVCGIGYKYLSLTQYNYITARTKEFASQITNSGPTTFITANFSHLSLELSGWYQVSRQLLQNQVVYPNFEMTAKYSI